MLGRGPDSYGTIFAYRLGYDWVCQVTFWSKQVRKQKNETTHVFVRNLEADKTCKFRNLRGPMNLMSILGSTPIKIDMSPKKGPFQKGNIISTSIVQWIC